MGHIFRALSICCQADTGFRKFLGKLCREFQTRKCWERQLAEQENKRAINCIRTATCAKRQIRREQHWASLLRAFRVAGRRKVFSRKPVEQSNFEWKRHGCGVVGTFSAFHNCDKPTTNDPVKSTKPKLVVKRHIFMVLALDAAGNWRSNCDGDELLYKATNVSATHLRPPNYVMKINPLMNCEPPRRFLFILYKFMFTLLHCYDGKHISTWKSLKERFFYD